MRSYKYPPVLHLLFALFVVLQSQSAFSQETDTLTVHKLKSLSLKELMNIEVTSVSKYPEKLKEVASAIQVISREDIRNSGVKTLPEALRLASNLQVAQVNASQWAISARGFNNVLANKLLVLVDGRTVYTPLYGGVYWDAQNFILEDVDRIEVISGPGGTLWGANAVNGVINIITRNSKDTKGLFAEAAVGSNLPGLASLRYGGQLDSKISYRVYGTGFKSGSTFLSSGSKAGDDWQMGQGGFRMDWIASGRDKLSLQGNLYDGAPNPDAGDTSVTAKGDNLVARWNHSASDKSGFQLQAYYDHRLRDFGNGFTEDLKTYDLDWQNRNELHMHRITYGANLRLMEHNVTNLQLFSFLPAHKTLYLYSAFLQDEIELPRERLNLTFGAKLEHNSYTGFEFQPNGRLAWMPAKDNTIWAAVSRAMKTPSRIDRDFYLLINPDLSLISGNDSLRSEELVAYELGWRSGSFKNVSISLSAFYNVYDNIRSAEPGTPPLGIPITFGNGVKGNTRGIELALNTQPASWWYLKGGYTYLYKNLKVREGSKDLNGGSAESNDPQHQLVIQSNIKLPQHLEFGTVIRYIGNLPKPYVSAYVGLDARIGWKIYRSVELNLVAQNLLDKRHTEFIPSSPSAREIPRSLYGKITCYF